MHGLRRRNDLFKNRKHKSFVCHLSKYVLFSCCQIHAEFGVSVFDASDIYASIRAYDGGCVSAGELRLCGSYALICPRALFGGRAKDLEIKTAERAISLRLFLFV